MKIIAGFFRFILTIILTVLIVFFQFATMTVATIQKAISPDILADLIRSGLEITASSKAEADPVRVCSSEFESFDEIDVKTSGTDDYVIVGEDGISSEETDLSSLQDLFSGFTISFNEETGVANFSGVEIDLKKTGILDIDFSSLNFDQETVSEIVQNSSLPEIISDYTAQITSSVLTGNDKKPELSKEQIVEAAKTLMESVGSVTDVDIPDEVQKNFVEEIEEKGDALALTVNNNMPDAEELEKVIVESANISEDTLDLIRKISGFIFRKVFLIILICVTVFFALLLVFIHYKNKFGWLWLSLISAFLGGLFVFIQGITSGGMLTSVIAKRVELPFDSSVLNILSVIGKTFGAVGRIVLYIALALLAVYILSLVFRRKGKKSEEKA